MIQVFPFETIESSYYRERCLAITNIDEVTVQKIVKSIKGVYEVAYHLIYKGEIVERKDATVSKECTYMEFDEIDRKYIKQLFVAYVTKNDFVQFVKEIEDVF
jgi:hypothetical protein|nr:MAG TPA: hypothetical protein [Caudoviricetes sp.]